MTIWYAVSKASASFSHRVRAFKAQFGGSWNKDVALREHYMIYKPFKPPDTQPCWLVLLIILPNNSQFICIHISHCCHNLKTSMRTMVSSKYLPLNELWPTRGINLVFFTSHFNPRAEQSTEKYEWEMNSKWIRILCFTNETIRLPFQNKHILGHVHCLISKEKSLFMVSYVWYVAKLPRIQWNFSVSNQSI
jgi:hypothetical protein